MKSTNSFVYRIFNEKEFMDFKEKKEFKGNQLDIDSGFIHLSTYEQVKGTLDKYFGENEHVFISKLRVADLFDLLKWEKSRDSDVFPHYYGILKFKFIIKTVKKNFFYEF